MQKFRIILVGDHRIMCDGLRALFRSQPDMEVVGEAEDEATAIRLAHELKPDVVVIDINISGANGIRTTRHISQEAPGIKIVVLSMYPKKAFVAEMLRAGASGYVLKNHTFSELIKAINTVMADEIYLCPKTTSVVVGDYIQSRSGGGGSSDEPLTDKERKVLELLADGKPSKEIAMLIDMSVKTVDARRRRIMQKLNVESVAELVKFAIRSGITSI